MSAIIAPSVLSANFGNLDNDIRMINHSKADWIHLDIMDGVFVPNLSYGFPVVEAIAKTALKPLDAHLMIVDPDKYIKRFSELNVQYLSVHYEACTHLHRSVEMIKSLGMKAGVAINPHTPVRNLYEILPDTDFILVMSVNPGFGGQSFIANTLSKVSKLKQMIVERDLNCLIEVDGGVNLSNAKLLIESGTDILVAGNSVFGTDNPPETIEKFKTL